MSTQKKVVNSDWFDVGKTYLGISFANVLMWLYRCEVQTLLDGLTWTSFDPDYVAPKPQWWEKPTSGISVDYGGLFFEDNFVVDFGEVSISIEPDAVDVLIRELTARLAEPCDPEATQRQMKANRSNADKVTASA